MATYGGTMPTLVDIASYTDNGGSTPEIAELLTESNPILDDVPWEMANASTGHRSPVRIGHPTVALRRLNEGVASSKGQVTHITDTMSMVEAWCTTDARITNFMKPSAAERFRMDENVAFVEEMGKKVVQMLFYGDETVDDREFTGLQPRYNDLGSNVLSAGGDNAGLETSIYLVGWRKGKVFGIYPQGSHAGLSHKDWGATIVQDGNNDPGGLKFAAYQDQFTFDAGLVVKDWRYVGRIANIDPIQLTALLNEQATAAFATNIIW